MEFVEGVIKMIEFKKNTSCVSFIRHQDSYKKHKEIIKLYNHFKLYSQFTVIIAGGYVTYLEGLTSSYTDVNVFVLVEFMHKSHHHCLYFLLNDYFKNKTISFYISPYYRSLTKAIYVWDHSSNILYNFIMIKSSYDSWMNHCDYLFSMMDLNYVKCSLSHDGTSIYRHITPSLLVDNPSTITLTRIKKFKSRLISYGSPVSLISICWNYIVNDFYGV